MFTAYYEEELPINHETSLNHWAKLMADEEIENGATNWDYEYEQAWHLLDAEFNYTYEYGDRR